MNDLTKNECYNELLKFALKNNIIQKEDEKTFRICLIELIIKNKEKFV